MHEDEKGRKIGQQRKKKKKERKKEKEEEEEDEEGMVPSKDPLRKPGVESNHQPFELESNALPLAPPGLGHASTRQVSTKQQPFLFLFFFKKSVYSLQLKSRSTRLLKREWTCMFPSLRVSKTHALEGLPYETIVDLMTTGLTRVRLQRFSVGEQMFPMLLHLLLEKRACIGLQG